MMDRQEGRRQRKDADPEGLTATVQPVETVLRGPVADQSSPHCLLDRIQSLDLELVEIRWLPTAAETLMVEPEPPP